METIESQHPELLGEKWADYISRQTENRVVVDNQWPQVFGESDDEEEDHESSYREIGCFTCDTPNIGTFKF